MLYLGVDIGGSNIAAAVINDEMQIIGKGNVKYKAGTTPDEFCDDILTSINAALKQCGAHIGECEYCGIGCPGVIDSASGTVEYSSNLGIKDLHLSDMMTERLHAPIYLENDANCAALGEVFAGAATGAESVLVVTLGTGIGGGIIINKHIYSGMNGLAGEIGHMSLFPNGEECSCGRRGCWEAYASATALKRQTRVAMEANPDSLLWKYAPTLDRVSGKTAFEALREGDSTAALVVSNYLFYVSEGLINCINILQPEIVCIGGGISNEGDDMLNPLRDMVYKHRYGTKPYPRIVCAKLSGNAGLFGAAMLGRQE